jgi:hypothetical protein
MKKIEIVTNIQINKTRTTQSGLQLGFCKKTSNVSFVLNTGTIYVDLCMQDSEKCAQRRILCVQCAIPLYKKGAFSN